MTKNDWLAKSHELRHKLAVLIFTILIGDLRIKAGLTAKTPPGDWYDNVYTPQCTAFCNAFDVWNNISTRTPVALDDLNKAEEDFIPLVRKLYNFVRENPVITDSDLEKMGFPKHSSGGHTPAQVAETAPYMIATAAGARIVDIGYGATQASRSKPAGQHGIEVIHEISDTKPELEQMTRSDFDTRTPLRITFHDSERGKTLWFAGRWENTRGQKGPFGEIQSVI
ncbi:MAG: hypothetical protein LBJ72_01460, partial [Dysgonamonadaceae bacterium]|nr:hypothetical protein [Dysgonamonadaceae bacterium]